MILRVAEAETYEQGRGTGADRGRELGFEIDLGTEYPAAWIFYEVLTVWFIIDMYFCFRTAYASAKGNMVTGELVIPGETKHEYLVSTYICHPAMANDNLSGVMAAMMLAQDCLDQGPARVGWRFAFVPETIGALAYLSDHEQDLATVKGGFVLSCCGGKGLLGYPLSRSIAGSLRLELWHQIIFIDQFMWLLNESYFVQKSLVVATQLRSRLCRIFLKEFSSRRSSYLLR